MVDGSATPTASGDSAHPRATVLTVDTHWFSERGGISTFNRQLCGALSRAGADVSCLVVAAGDAERDDAARAGVRLLTARCIRGQAEREALMNRADMPIGRHPDLIIGHGRITGYAALAQRANFYPDAKYLHIIHTSPDDSEWYKPAKEDPAGKLAEEKWEQELALVREAHQVLAVGPLLFELANDYLERDGGTIQPIQLDPGFDWAPNPAKKRPDSTRQVTMIGRLQDEGKGVELAARAVGAALRKMDSDGRDIQLVLRGVPDGMGRKLREDVRRWSALPSLRVKARGYSASLKEVHGDLRGATLVLMPSLAEGFGLVGLEAIATGTPVLVSERSGLGKLLLSRAHDHARGIVLAIKEIPRLDVELWAAAVARILQDPAAAVDRAASLLGVMQRECTWATTAERVLEAWSVAPPSRGPRQSSAPSHLEAFICYEEDGREFADKLRTTLWDMVDHVTPWPPRPRTHIDPEYAHLSQTEAVDRVLLQTAVVLFVLTRGSARVTPTNWCLDLLNAARQRNLPIVVLQKAYGVRVPTDLPDARVVDFTGDVVDDALRQLALALEQIGAEDRGTGYAGPEPASPSDGESLDEPAIEESLPQQVCVAINEMPEIASASFCDRDDSMRLLQSKLADQAIGLVVLESRNGMGKTALLRRLRELCERGLAPISLTAFVYFSARGYRWITVPTLLADLTQAIPDPASQQRLHDLVRDKPWRTVFDEVLAELSGRPVAVVVDDADALFDSQGEWRDRDLDELVTALAERSDHRVILVMSMTEIPRGLARPVRVRRRMYPLSLSKGLPPEDAMVLMRDLDDDLLVASDAELAPLHHLTAGHPRALELIVGLLRTRGDVTVDRIPGLLQDTSQSGDASTILKALVALIIVELRREEKRVLQALAVFARPVRPDAVSYLLKQTVPNLRAKTVLDGLVWRFLVYRYGDHYCLPPKPDGEFVLSTLLTREDAGQSSTLTLDTLWLRGAAYFSDQQTGVVPSRIDDLWPWFGEIELRLRAGQHEKALDLMDELDDKHLTRWGQSHVLSSWRNELREKLQGPALKGRNLFYLFAARRQQEGHRTDFVDIEAALGYARGSNDPSVNEVSVTLQFANALFERGDLSAAIDRYNHVVEQAGLYGLLRDKVDACAGLSVCLAKTGSFGPAEEQLREAFHVLDQMDPINQDEPRALLLLNEAWLAGQRGRYATARRSLEEGYRLAENSAGQLLVGSFRRGQAENALALGRLADAVRLAEQAAEIGLRLDNHRLLREANTIRSLALLEAGDLAAAALAIDAATRYATTSAALSALGVQGLVAFRQGDDAKARGAFYHALSLCQPLSRGDEQDRDYQLSDARGVVLCGLALLDEAFTVDDAVQAFIEARGIASEPGVRDHIDLILLQFGDDADPDILARVRAVASGSGPSGP